MSYITSMAGTYNLATQKVVPKDAIVLKDLSPLPAKNPAFVVRQWGELVRDDWPGITKLLKSIGDQIEEQTKPPRIPEPGLWGVVEAFGQRDIYEEKETLQWIRTDEATWRNVSCGYGVTWDDLENPKLIRPGV